jgi:hypothetical protein
MVNGIRGLSVVELGPGNALGVGTITAATGDSLIWTPPGGEAGAAVTVLRGERAVLAGADSDAAYVVVQRTDSLPMGGAVAVQVMEGYNNAIGGRDTTTAELAAGITLYAGVFLRNEDTVAWDSIKAWIDVDCDPSVAVALEDTDGSGDIQEITDDEDSPTGLTFSTSTSEGGASIISSVAVGDSVGLWIQRTIEADGDASGRRPVRIKVKMVRTGDDITVTLTGLFRSAGVGGFIVSVEDTPPGDTITPLWVGAAGDWDIDDLDLVEGIHYFAGFAVNEYNIYSAGTVQQVTIDDVGDVSLNPPRPPGGVSVNSVSLTDARITATYAPEFEGDDIDEINDQRGNEWLVYITTDGTDPLLATPEVVDMEYETGDLPEFLSWDSDPILDDSPVRVAVKVRRNEGAGVVQDSTATLASMTHKIDGVSAPRAWAFAGNAAGLWFGKAGDGTGTITVDAGKGITWYYSPGSLRLQANGKVLFRMIYRGANHPDNGFYIPAEYEVTLEAYDGGDAGENDAVGFDTWDGSNKEVVLRARGQNLAVFDVVTMQATINALTVDDADISMEDFGYIYTGYNQSLYSPFDEEYQRNRPMAALMAETGELRVRGKLEFTMNEAAILAL